MLVAEIGTLLHNRGVGAFDAMGSTGNIFIMTQPSAPDNCIAIYQRGGTSSDTKLGYDNVSVEILVRDIDVQDASNKAQEIYNLLHGYKERYFIPLGTYIIICMALQGAPNFIGKDQNKRFEFSLNFDMQIKNFEGGRDNGNTKL